MFEKTLIMYIYAETPLHPGSGTTITGIADLPIQRERHTGFPIIQGSSLKGVLRSSACWIEIDQKCTQCKGDSKRDVENCEVIKELFGNPEGIGGISITDAKILAFPVRTLRGVFGWIMSPLILERYKRDLFLLGRSIDWSIPKLASNEEARVGKGSNLIVEEDGEKCIYIEDLQLKCIEDEYVEKIARDVAGALPKNDVYKELKERFEKDLIIVSDDVFKDLVYLTTEIVTRIKIDPETGVVSSRALWSEEYLPTDTLMYSLILSPSRLNAKKIEEICEKIKKYDEKILQIGGDETVGKGFARIKLGGK